MATKFIYSDQDVVEVTQKYLAGVTLEVLAEEYNKSVASVRMKLVKLGVYVAKGKSKASNSIDAFTDALSPPKPVAKPAAKPKSSLTKAGKAALAQEFKTLYDKFGPAPF